MRRTALTWAIIVGAAGVLAMIAGFVVDPTQAAFSYLTAWAFALSLALGALVLLMIGNAAEARWTIPFQPYTESIVRTLPALAVLFVPILLAARWLYPWIDDTSEHARHQAPYLNLTFWAIRAVVFFAIWIAFGELSIRWRDARARVIGAASLPVIALTLTFGSFDWLMSLTPHWYSTIYGLLYWAGGFVGAMSLIALVARAPAAPSGALGRMMFAFLIFWGYMEFSQGIIIWIANKPDEVPWYVARGAEHWFGALVLLVVAGFFMPFFALLSRPLKRRAHLLAIVGGWLVAMHYVDMYWMVMPVLHVDFAPHWLDLAAPCAVLGIAVAVALLRRPPPLSAERIALARSYEGS